MPTPEKKVNDSGGVAMAVGCGHDSGGVAMEVEAWPWQ